MDFDFSPEHLRLKDQARRFLADQGTLGAAIPKACGGLGGGAP